jgi:hypothetical protein
MIPDTPLERLPGPPTQEGWYWFTREPEGRGMLYEVRWIEGQLMGSDCLKTMCRLPRPVDTGGGHYEKALALDGAS